MAKCGPALPSYARKSLILDGLMNQDEIVLFNLVDAYVARCGYGVSRIEAEPSGAFHRVELTNPERNRSKRIMVFADHLRATVDNRKLSDAITLNLDSELRDDNGGPIGRSA